MVAGGFDVCPNHPESLVSDPISDNVSPMGKAIIMLCVDWEQRDLNTFSMSTPNVDP